MHARGRAHTFLFFFFAVVCIAQCQIITINTIVMIYPFISLSFSLSLSHTHEFWGCPRAITTPSSVLNLSRAGRPFTGSRGHPSACPDTSQSRLGTTRPGDRDETGGQKHSSNNVVLGEKVNDPGVSSFLRIGDSRTKDNSCYCRLSKGELILGYPPNLGKISDIKL